MLQRVRLGLLLLILSVAGCTKEPTPPLRLGTNVWPGYEPLYLAREKSMISSRDIHLVEFLSASQVIQAFRNNMIDAAALTLDESLLLLQSSEQFNIVLVMDESSGSDAIVGQAHITGLADLVGKRVGIENNAMGAYMFTRAMEIAQLDPDLVEVVPLDISQHEQAFLNGQVAAVVTFDPVRSKLISAGGHSLFNSNEIPSEILDVLIVRTDYLNEYPTVVQSLVDGWYQTLALIKASPGPSAKILGLRMGLDEAQTLAVYQGLKLPDAAQNQAFFAQPNPALLVPLKQLASFMIGRGLLKASLEPTVLFSHQPIKHRLTKTGNQ